MKSSGYMKYLFASVVLAWSVHAQAGDNSVRVGIMANPVGVVPHVEYEHVFSDKVSIGGRLGTIAYSYEDGSYEEDGVGQGAEFIVRFYPRGEGPKGFYVGGGLGIWNVAWEWTDPEDTPSSDEGTSTALNLNVNLGWKIPLGSDRVYIDPSIVVGHFGSVSSDDEANLGLYVGGGVAVGFVF